MVFSSLIFISIFLPAVFIGCRLLPSVGLQNGFLLIASLIFYGYGEPVYVFLMIATAALDYLWALGMEKYPEHRKLLGILAVIQNLGVLAVFKYAGFLADLWNDVTGMGIPVPVIALPIGISFFTFQAMSYVLDVYRQETPAQKSFFRLLLYISFFPQLIAGPIVKYHDIEVELENRQMTPEGIATGIRRFICGLGKKVLIANTMGAVADTLYAAPATQVNAFVAWAGALAYLLQIYYDFSGYSDMAIGLGWMFGFHFKENFNYPYIASSVKDFWKRWHISLSGWFREYLYFPLGGNRKGRGRTVINKFIVFACTGIWHGANLTFLFWGLYHGFFLMLEEICPAISRRGGKIRSLLQHIYTILVVTIGFVFFRTDTMAQGWLWVKNMFSGFRMDPAAMRLFLSVLTPLNLTVFVAGALLAAPWVPRYRQVSWLERLSWIVTPCILILCVMSLAGGTYNPFIYFRF